MSLQRPTADPDAPDTRPSRRDLAPTLRAGLIALLAIAGFLVLLLLLNSLGLIRLPGVPGAAPTQPILLGETPAAGILGGNADPYPAPTSNIPPPGPPPGPPPPVGARFESFYYARGGERVLGRPIAPAEIVNGREIQWFERARIEHWPEYAGTPYEFQLGLLGVEYTEGREFARQGYFVGHGGLRYFPETGHAVGGVFLRCWEQYGGLDTFGFPISEEFDEVLPDGNTYRVQYFERARMEYHPAFAGTPNEVQFGLLGSALYRNEARPNTIQPVPTRVPMP